MANVIDEFVIACGREESVIDIESDASTMTGDMVSSMSTKRKCNGFIEMPQSISSNLLNKKPRKCNILELISEQRIGNKPNPVFSFNMTSLIAGRLKSTNVFTTVHPEVHVSDCEFIRSGQDGSYILGLWKGNQYDAILYKIVLNVSSRGNYEDDNHSFLKNIEHIGPFFSKTNIIDMCDTNVRNQKFVLYVGNYYNQNFTQQSSAVLCSFANSSTAGKQYMSTRNVLCCCGSQTGEVFATGTDEGVFIYQDQNFIFHSQHTDKINSVEFNSTANILYCGTDKSKILILDRRACQGNNNKIEVTNWSSGISETKLLNNENNMLVSSFDSGLSQIDLRTGGSVVNYPGHVCNKKIPFSFSENANLLCATGTDTLTRLWSLQTGSYLCTIRPQIKTKKAFSCLIADESRWLVAIFQKNKMYVVEPEN